MRTFGPVCWPYLRPYNECKLQFRSKRCVFIGYSMMHRGYRCLHVSTGRVYISRDVIFEENLFPFSIGTPKQTPDQILEQILVFSPEAMERADSSNQHAEISDILPDPVWTNLASQPNFSLSHVQETATKNPNATDPSADSAAGADPGADSPGPSTWPTGPDPADDSVPSDGPRTPRSTHREPPGGSPTRVLGSVAGSTHLDHPALPAPVGGGPPMQPATALVEERPAPPPAPCARTRSQAWVLKPYVRTNCMVPYDPRKRGFSATTSPVSERASRPLLLIPCGLLLCMRSSRPFSATICGISFPCTWAQSY